MRMQALRIHRGTYPPCYTQTLERTKTVGGQWHSELLEQYLVVDVGKREYMRAISQVNRIILKNRMQAVTHRNSL